MREQANQSVLEGKEKDAAIKQLSIIGGTGSRFEAQVTWQFATKSKFQSYC